MRKSCESCGSGFEAKRAAARYCSARCRQRAHRKPAPDAGAEVAALPAEAATESLARATRAELEAANRLHTAIGQAALVLARRIDSAGAETGSSLAALTREHRATLAEALRDVKSAADPLDELRMRRERKLASG